MEPRRSKHFLAHIPTIALLVVFAMSAPLGVLFFILRAIDRDAEKRSRRTRNIPAISVPRTPVPVRQPGTLSRSTATMCPLPSSRTPKSGTRP